MLEMVACILSILFIIFYALRLWVCDALCQLCLQFNGRSALIYCSTSSRWPWVSFAIILSGNKMLDVARASSVKREGRSEPAGREQRTANSIIDANVKLKPPRTKAHYAAQLLSILHLMYASGLRNRDVDTSPPPSPWCLSPGAACHWQPDVSYCHLHGINRIICGKYVSHCLTRFNWQMAKRKFN